jgi:DNA integrity scanning protein DisA with diadenylate cyclase activity
MFLPFELRWQDIVDILLNSYILFRLYILFRGTNAFRVFFGIMGLLFVQRIAVAVGLILTSWVIQGITAVAALIVVVVFRNEIRSALQGRNLKNFLWGNPRPLVQTPHACIAGAAFGLAEKKIGGLIVLPGGSDIRQKIHSSLRIGCRLSREMLMSVFWPDNPVHDGAAVVLGDRIEEVAAVLPFSQRDDLPSYYGMRHRAAAGIAEATDAIAIVISEERGTVSAAYGDTFEAFADAAGLERWLERLRPDAAVVTGRREAITMAVAGVVSLLFITSVWFGFARRDGTLITMEIPLEYVRRDSNFVYVDADVDTVRLQLSGAEAMLKNISASQLKARVGLSSGVIGENIFKLEPDNFSLPPGVVLRKVTPETVTVSLDIDAIRSVPVQVDWVGTLPSGPRIEDCEVIPEQVQVRGPSLLMEEIATVYTEAVDVASLPPQFTKDVPLVVPQAVRLIGTEKVSIRCIPAKAGE